VTGRAPVVTSVVRLVAVGWWLQLKIRGRSAFDGLLGVLYPIFFATTVFFIYRQSSDQTALVTAAVGASVMGVWSATSTTASSALQSERRQGTLELLVAAPTSFPLLVIPITASMATVGLYSLVATLLWGRFAFGIPVRVADPAGFALAVLVTVVAIAIMGFLEAVASVRYRSAWALGTAFELPIWLVCGFLVPVASLPGWVRPISWVLPPTWGVAAVKAAALGQTAWGDIGLCALTAACYGLVGAVLSTVLLDSARARATLALS
jgi:ABC-2 type transport system permease protein